MALRKTKTTQPAPITRPVPDSVLVIERAEIDPSDTRRKLRQIERHYRDEMRFVIKTQPLAGAQ